jgi:hypothetical protein
MFVKVSRHVGSRMPYLGSVQRFTQILFLIKNFGQCMKLHIVDLINELNHITLIIFN